MMVVDNKFNFGDVVYLKTDTEQKTRIVTSINLKPSNIIYELSCETESSYHYDFEISIEKDVLITSTN